MVVLTNRKIYEFACELLNKFRKDESINLKEEARKLNANSKDRKKIVSLLMNYLNHKDEVKEFKKENRIKCKKHNLNDHLIRLMLTEIFYSPCFKEDSFEKNQEWNMEWNFLTNFKEQIDKKKKTIVLRELPVKQDKKRKSSNDKNQGQQNKKLKKLNNDCIDLFKDVEELPVKYLRVNRIKTTIEELVYELVNDLKLIQVGGKFDCFNDFLKKLFNLKSNEFMIDYHFPDDLLVVNSDLKKVFQEYRIYQNGKVIFQDKASLIPLKCANLKKNMNIADICCCPGMKTFGISSELKNDCKIISVDIDSERIKVMKDLMDKLGVNCTKIIELDFTETTRENFKFTDNKNDEIDVLFLDPSCSGSGMIDKRNGEIEKQNDSNNRQRLMKLASFQTKLLAHAMSLKPKLIVYSTCSFSVWENEFVICKVQEQAESAADYELINAFPEWPQNGDKKYSCANLVLRAGPNRGTRGFFCSVFKRTN